MYYILKKHKPDKKGALKGMHRGKHWMCWLQSQSFMKGKSKFEFKSPVPEEGS